MCPYHASKHSHSWNIDFDTATIGPGPPINSLDPSEYWWLDDSLNIIAIKVAESDVGYPVRIYGTVLARDQQDYRCVYLFRRSRDNPQLITSPVCTHVSLLNIASTNQIHCKHNKPVQWEMQPD
jgi:hypothetical protein